MIYLPSAAPPSKTLEDKCVYLEHVLEGQRHRGSENNPVQPCHGNLRRFKVNKNIRRRIQWRGKNSVNVFISLLNSYLLDLEARQQSHAKYL